MDGDDYRPVFQANDGEVDVTCNMDDFMLQCVYFTMDGQAVEETRAESRDLVELWRRKHLIIP